VPGVPSIEVDNRTGMDVLLDHLVLQHGYRKLAFIAGPAGNMEATVRYDAYRNALQRHGIAFDPKLVAQGNFARRSGNAALEQILMQGSKPDVVVAANDLMALGAVTALREHGFHVPRQMAVSGFDDLVVSRLGDPPLTTVSQPIDSMVQQAVKLVLRQLAGEEVPHLTIHGDCRVHSEIGVYSFSTGLKQNRGSWIDERSEREFAESLPGAPCASGTAFHDSGRDRQDRSGGALGPQKIEGDPLGHGFG